MSRIMDDLAKGRRCAICGKLGGIGSTTILRMLGYQIPEREIGYAHANCIRKARAKMQGNPATCEKPAPATGEE